MEAEDWRRLYIGLLRGIAEAGATGRPLSELLLPHRVKPARPAKRQAEPSLFNDPPGRHCPDE